MIAFRVALALVLLAFAAGMLYVLAGGYWAVVRPQPPRSLHLRGWPPYQAPSCTYYPDWSDAPYGCKG